MNVLKNVSELSLDAWFAQNGADVGSWMIETVYSEMVPALQRGTVDGVIFSEPTLSIAVASGAVQVLSELSTPIARQFLVSGWFASEQFAQRNGDSDEALRRCDL